MSGASGGLGQALRQALQPEAQILQLVRRSPVNASQLQWDPEASRPVFSPESLEGCSAALHLSGANVAEHRWTPEYKRSMYTSRVHSTHALCEVLARLQNPPPTLLVASATGIYGDRGDELLDEDSPLGRGFLADLCSAWEEAAQPALAAGIRVVHLRFGVVLSASSGALAKMLPIFRLGLGGRLGSGRQWMSWIALPDLVAAVDFALHKQSLSGAMNVVAPNPVTNAEFTHALARRLHRPALFPAPAWGLKLAFGEMAQEALLSSARVLPKKLNQAGFPFAYATIDAGLTAAFAV